MYKVFLSVHVRKKPPILKPLLTWRRFTWAFCPWRAGHRQECPGTQSTADGARGDTAVPRRCATLHGTDRSPMPWQQQGTPRAWTPQPPARRNNTFTSAPPQTSFEPGPASLIPTACLQSPAATSHGAGLISSAAQQPLLPGQLQPTAEPGWRGVPAPPHPHSTAALPWLTPIGSIGPRRLPAAAPARCPASCASPQRHSSLQGSREPPQPRLVLFDVLYQLFTLKHPWAQQPHHLSLLENIPIFLQLRQHPHSPGHSRAWARGPSSRLHGAHRHSEPAAALPIKDASGKAPPSPGAAPLLHLSSLESSLPSQLPLWGWGHLAAPRHRADLGFHQVLPRVTCPWGEEAEQHNPLTPFRCAFSLQGSLTVLINTCGAPPAERQRCLSDVASDTTFPI